MNSKTKILFFILSISCRSIICSTFATQSVPKYDLTQAIRSSINTLFQNVEAQYMSKFLKRMDSHNISIKYQLENDIILKEIHVSVMGSPSRKFNCDFANNKMDMTIGQLYTGIDGSVCANKKDNVGYLLSTVLSFYNVSINSIESLKNCKEDYSFHISYSKVEIRLNDNSLKRVSPQLDICTEEQKQQMKKKLESVLPKLTLDTVKNNEKFATALSTSPFLQPKRSIISTIPDFLHNEKKYYYFIRDVPFPFFNFKNITIRGLSNFESFKFNGLLGEAVHTLMMKDIRGNLTLDYKSKNQTSSKSLELDFTADYLDISVDLDKKRVNVEARDYRVIRSEFDTPLTYDQSALIMHHIEFAIAYSIMPFTKIWWNDNQPSRRYDKEDQVRQTLDGIANKKGPYDYQISFHNVTVKLISGIPYPQQIHCEFPNNLNITHRINAKPIGNLRLNNEEDSTIDINFHVNFTSISFSINNLNKSKENDTCEFQIHPNQDIKVDFSSLKNVSGLKGDELKLKEKLDQTMISMEKNSLTRVIKTVVCSPFNLCTKSAKIVEEYFLGFVNTVLRKCALRRNTT